MLQIDIRPSIDRAVIAGPKYSITCPVAPPVPILRMIARMMSLGSSPAPSRPVTSIPSECGRKPCQSVCVARTCSTSLVPIPNASAPKAPWVLVWLSPQTIVVPGSVTPSSGPITCTIPCRPLWMS